MQVTHRPDLETGHMRQIVSPEELRRVLDQYGETYEKPTGFGPEDEWEVE